MVHGRARQKIIKPIINPIDVVSGKSKTTLLAITTLGGSAAGLDRLYMGCRSTGLLKLFLFLFAAIVIGNEMYKDRSLVDHIYGNINEIDSFDIENNQLLAMTMRLVIFLMLWTFFDAVVVFYNSLSGTYDVPYTYCRGKHHMWSSVKDVEQAKMFALLLIIVILVGGIFIPNYILGNMVGLLIKSSEKFTGGFKQY